MVERVDPFAQLTSKHALLFLRLGWAVTVVMVPVFAVIVYYMRQSDSAPRLSINPGYVWIGLLTGTVIAMLIGNFARMQIYKRHWQGDVITPKGYLLGNHVFMSLIMLPLIATLGLIFITGQIVPMIWPGAVALFVVLINFPTGKPMRPARPQSQYDTVARE